MCVLHQGKQDGRFRIVGVKTLIIGAVVFLKQHHGVLTRTFIEIVLIQIPALHGGLSQDV